MGALMGVSATWPILALAQEFCADKAIRKNLTLISGNRTKNFVAICGDDLIAAWTSEFSETYFDVLKLIGLKRNVNKEYRSKLGGVFIEKAFTVRKHIGEELPQPPETDSKPGEVSLWAYIKLKFNNNEYYKPSIRRQKYMKIHYIQRPLLSAIVLAKAFARAGMVRPSKGQEDAPAFLTLGPCLTKEWNMSSEPWRKAAVIHVAMKIHRRVISRMEKSGIPLFYPRSLGGWGLPGKQVAPSRFRKASAAILNGQGELQKKLSNIFLFSKAPAYLRKKLNKGLKAIQDYPERFSPSAKPMTLQEASRDYTSRVLAYHGHDPTKSKLQQIRYKNVGTIARLINNTIDKANKTWKSAKPMAASKALKLHNIFETKMVDTQYMNILLGRNGVYDNAVRDIIGSKGQSHFIPLDNIVTSEKIRGERPKQSVNSDRTNSSDENDPRLRYQQIAMLYFSEIAPESEIGEQLVTWRNRLDTKRANHLKSFVKHLGKSVTLQKWNTLDNFDKTNLVTLLLREQGICWWLHPQQKPRFVSRNGGRNPSS
jgi:hypothetical protein